MKRLTLVYSLAILFLASIGLAHTWHVPTVECPNIQAGLDSAAAGDTVLVACGYYGEHDIAMKSGVCLRSETGEPDCVMIDAQRYGSVFCCENVDSTATIEGFELVRSWGGDGGGLYCYFSSPSVNNCIFVGHSVSGQGGALFCDHSSPQITDCTFYHNDADNGGGAIHCRSSWPIMRDCLFSYNYSRKNGGAISCGDSAMATLINCVFADNWADSAGGGIDCSCSSARVSNCTFYNNHGGEYASGIHLRESSSVTVENTIIAFGSESPAVACLDGSSASLAFCDIYGNAVGDWVGCIASQYGINGNFSANPRFCDPENGDLHLYATSPCGGRSGCGVIGALGVGCGLHRYRMAEGIPYLSPKGTSKPETAAGACLDIVCGDAGSRKVGLRYHLPSAGSACLRIHDVEGRLIKTLTNRTEVAGSHLLIWDRFSDNGGRVSPGVYFVQLQTVEGTVTRKVVLVQ
jgi:predicted outer membrane repeat protein